MKLMVPKLSFSVFIPIRINLYKDDIENNPITQLNTMMFNTTIEPNLQINSFHCQVAFIST